MTIFTMKNTILFEFVTLKAFNNHINKNQKTIKMYITNCYDSTLANVRIVH